MTRMILQVGTVSGAITHRNGRTVSTTAIFSECKRYRYRLTRDLTDDLLAGKKNPVLFIMLNPSTATESKDDPTIRKIQGFARAWGHTELWIGNAFAWRATDPDDMKKVPYPVGEDNDVHLASMAVDASRIIVAWGKDGKHRGRDQQVLKMLAALGVEIYCLGQNGDGTPRHPLYLKNSTVPRIIE